MSMKKKSKVEEVKEGSCGVNPISKYFKHGYFDWVEDIKKARCRTYGTTINRPIFSPFLSAVTKTSSLRCRRVIKENQALDYLCNHNSHVWHQITVFHNRPMDISNY